jgi:hypothetical protein
MRLAFVVFCLFAVLFLLLLLLLHRLLSFVHLSRSSMHCQQSTHFHFPNLVMIDRGTASHAADRQTGS